MRIRMTFIACLVASLAAAPAAFAQAAVGYGISAARAGSAGAAAGGGLGAVFSKLGRKTGEATEGASAPVNPSPRFEEGARKQPTAVKLHRDSLRQPQRGKVALRGGFAVAGASLPARAQARAAKPAVAEVWQVRASAASASAEPASDRTEAAGAPALQPAHAPTDAAAPHEPAQPAASPSPSSSASDAVPSSSKQGVAAPRVEKQSSPADTSAAADAPPRSEARRAHQLASEIQAGEPVQSLIERFGLPYMALRGVAGEGYNEKYIFKLQDGARIVIYARQGTVTQASAEPPGSQMQTASR